MEPLRTVDLRVLHAVAGRHGDGPASVDAVADDAGVELSRVLLAVRVLHQHDLIEITNAHADDGSSLVVTLRRPAGGVARGASAGDDG